MIANVRPGQLVAPHMLRIGVRTAQILRSSCHRHIYAAAEEANPRTVQSYLPPLRSRVAAINPVVNYLMSQDSPAAKRARLLAGATQTRAQEPASETVAEAAAAADQLTAANGTTAGAATTLGRRRRRVASPTQRTAKQAEQQPEAAAAAADDTLAEAQQAPSAGRTRRRTTSPRRSTAKAAEPAPAQAAVEAASAAVSVEPPAAARKQERDDAAAQGISGTQAASTATAQQPQPSNQQQQQQAAAALPAAANGHASAVVQQQQQQKQKEQQQAQQQQQQQQTGKKAAKKQKIQSQSFQTVIGIHQCIKRDLPHEALHLYRQLRAAGDTKALADCCSPLLNVLVGKWQWELHQRHQHLLRQYAAAGRDTASLDAAAAAIADAVLAERQQQREAEENILSPMAMPVVDAPDMAPELMCYVEKHVELTPPDKLKDKAWLDGLLVGMSEVRPPLLDLLAEAVDLVVSDMKAAGHLLDEQMYLQLARVAGIMGNPDKAFDYAKELVAGWQAGGPNSGKLAPRLRDFQPALVGYALAGDADKAQHVVDMMLQHCNVDLTESEFALWLEAIANGGTYQQLSAALAATAGELNQLRSPTVELVARFFRSERAAAALAADGPLAALGKRSWQQQWVTPNDEGHVAEAGVTLQMSDLSAADWESFGQQVRQLAEQQEKQQGKFKVFCDWLQRKGPFDIMIDGANVALWGENYDGGAFRPEKMRVMYETVQEQNPEAKILLVLHAGRHNDVRHNHRELFEWLEQLRLNGSFYVTPAGSNDDWYWMYAAVQARENGLLVSNDQLRDHVWNLLRPKHMLKWTQRHLIRYTFNFEKTQPFLEYPLPYTPCVQQDAEKGVWMVPVAGEGNKWLCCKAV